MAVTTLLEVGDKLRRGEIPADDVIVLAEGGELDAKELRPVLLAFGRLRRLERKIAQLNGSLRDKRQSKTSRASFGSRPNKGLSFTCSPVFAERAGFEPAWALPARSETGPH